ncbi:hypothetical protein ACI797_10175 [Geodermatophilus sp. SYSU D00691]
MLLITCPVTGRDELISALQIRGIANHADHIAVTVACPCGETHVHRTGRRWAEATPVVPAREAAELIPA